MKSFDSKNGRKKIKKRNYDEYQCECKELDDWGSCGKDYMWNPSTCDCKCNEACKIDEYLDTKNCACKNCLIGKLVLGCKDEILNTIKTTPDDKKETCKKSNCLIRTISLVMICLLLLAVVFIGCYYYYSRDWIKKEYVLSY